MQQASPTICIGAALFLNVILLLQLSSNNRIDCDKVSSAERNSIIENSRGNDILNSERSGAERSENDSE